MLLVMQTKPTMVLKSCERAHISKPRHLSEGSQKLAAPTQTELMVKTGKSILC